MTGKDLNKVKEGKGKEQIKGSTSERELVATLSDTPLTVEQQVAQLRSEVQNLNKGMFELLDLFKEVLKKQVSTEAMIEQNMSDINKKIDATTTRINENIYSTTHETQEKIKTVSSKVNETKAEITSDTEKIIDNVERIYQKVRFK